MTTPSFSRQSERHLLDSDPRLQALFEHVITGFDCSILCGRRNRADQEEAFRTGHSKARYGQSPHNVEPFSLAIDAAPYPIDWDDTDRFVYFGGFVLGVAHMLEVPLIWGGDWNNNRTRSDQTFNDLVHFEIANWRDEQ